MLEPRCSYKKEYKSSESNFEFCVDVWQSAWLCATRNVRVFVMCSLYIGCTIREFLFSIIIFWTVSTAVSQRYCCGHIFTQGKHIWRVNYSKKSLSHFSKRFKIWEKISKISKKITKYLEKSWKTKPKILKKAQKSLEKSHEI